MKMTQWYPRALQMWASPIPVLPAVPSTTVPPALSCPGRGEHTHLKPSLFHCKNLKVYFWAVIECEKTSHVPLITSSVYEVFKMRSMQLYTSIASRCAVRTAIWLCRRMDYNNVSWIQWKVLKCKPSAHYACAVSLNGGMGLGYAVVSRK